MALMETLLVGLTFTWGEEVRLLDCSCQLFPVLRLSSYLTQGSLRYQVRLSSYLTQGSLLYQVRQHAPLVRLDSRMTVR